MLEKTMFILLLAFSVPAQAADTTGTWVIRDLQVGNRVQFSLQVTDGGKANFQSSSEFDISQVQGLTTAQVASPSGTIVRFEIMREAGTFICEGYFKAGSGAGTFLFKPNLSFVSQMASLGFSDVEEDKLFSMAVHDIGMRYAAEIQAMGLKVPSASKLIAMKIHGVTPEYVRKMQARWPEITLDQLISLRIHGID
jgi:hypothetical protein